MGPEISGKGEWAAGWPLPFVAMLGILGCTIFAYSSGVFMEPVTRELGWTRTQYSFSFVLQMMMGLIIGPIGGKLVDRFGPRPVALIGIPIAAFGISAFALASGPIWQWYLLCVLHSICAGMILPAVWVSAVVGRFHASRGLALSIALSGMGLGVSVWPLMAALFIRVLDWRLAFPALGLTWAVLIFPLAYFLFFGAPAPAKSDVPKAADKPPGYLQLLRSRTFLCLVAAGGLFSSVILALTLHLVPMLHQDGIDLTAAAGLAGLIGVFTIIGRLGTGYLLDRLPTRPLGIFVFSAPILVAALLWYSNGSLAFAIVAVALLGLLSGAETDIIVYIAAREFGAGVFASVYASASALFSICASLGPLIAAFVYDSSGSYDLYLFLVAPLALTSTTLIALIPSRGRPGQSPAHTAPAIVES